MNDCWALFGGVFALLVFWHFFADWLFQSHDEAMKKSHDLQTRTNHCLIYTFFFIPVMGVLGLSMYEAMFCSALLFFSHLFEDTYIPVMLWVKYVRNPPQFTFKNDDGSRVYTDVEAFKAFVSTPLGMIIMIVVDQLVHIAFLFPIAYYAVQSSHPG